MTPFEKISCYPCGMTFDVKEPLKPSRAERLKCSECGKPFWSACSERAPLVARVGIDPARVEEWR